MQTGASALLAAASIATLYALVHFFDLFRRNPTVAVEPQRVEFEPEPAVDIPARPNVSAQLARIEEQLTAYNAVEEMPIVEMAIPTEAQPVEPAPPPAKANRRAKTPRKSSGRRASAAEEVKVADLAAPASAEQPAPPEVVEAAEPESFEESFHPPVAPLFEPEPFVRQQQRSMFGRKAG